MTLISNFRGHLLEKTTCSMLQREPISDWFSSSFRYVEIYFFLSNLQAGGARGINESGTNEDTHCLPVIWRKDAFFTYLQLLWNCWTSCYPTVFLLQLSMSIRPTSDWISIRFRQGFDQFSTHFRSVFRTVSTTPLRRTMTTRTMFVIVLNEAYFISMPYFALYQTNM